MRAERSHLERRDGMCQVIDGTGGAGEMQHVVHRTVDLDRFGDIVLDELERGLFGQVGDVAAIAGQQVIRHR